MKESCRKQGAPSPCAACRLLRRRCAQDCVFAPYFPADEPTKFANVHKVFGASNVNKMLQVSSNFQFSICTYIHFRDKLMVCLGSASRKNAFFFFPFLLYYPLLKIHKLVLPKTTIILFSKLGNQTSY